MDEPRPGPFSFLWVETDFSPQKIFFGGLILFSVAMGPWCRAQGEALATNRLSEMLPRPSPQFLLPQPLGPMESLLWNTNGLFRRGGQVTLTPAVRNDEMKLRRAMLTGHMVGGLITAGLLISTVVVGQTMIDRPLETAKWLPTHQTLVIASVSTYSVTALLAAFSPPPLMRRSGFSTIALHRALAFVHLTGMFLTPILGLLMSRSASPDDLIRFHQISGITTAAALTLSMVVLAF